MPQIPDWTQVGTEPPQVTPRRVYPNESGQTVARGVAELGAGLEHVSDVDYEQNQKAQISSANDSLLDHQVAVADTTENIRQQVASGDLSWDKAESAYQDATSKLTLPDFPGLNGVAADSVQRQAQRQINTGLTQVQGIARAGRKQSFADDFQAAQDKLGKLAGMPGADVAQINGQIDFYRQQGLEAGIPAANVDKSIQDFKDRNWYNEATQRSMEAKDNAPALQQLQHDLTAQDGFYAGKLDTDRRNAILRGVINDQMVLQQRNEHEQDKREAKAAGIVGKIEEQNASGIPATPDMWGQWGTQLKGTSFEGDFKELQQNEDQIQQLLRQPIDQQLKYVQDKTADLEQNGGSLKDQANLIRLARAVESNRKLMETAPLLFGQQRTGQTVQPLDFSQLGTDQGKEQFQQQIADRMASLKALRAQYGGAITPTPLLPQERAQLTASFDAATPAERVGLLTQLRGAMNDDMAYQNTMRQIAPGSPVTALAGSKIGSSAPAATPLWFDQRFAPTQLDVERILRGEALLNPSSGGKAAQAQQETAKGAKTGIAMPPDQDTQNAMGLQRYFANSSGDLFRGRPQLEGDYYSAYRAAYAALASEKGNYSGKLDTTLARQASQIALGNTISYQGHTVSVPAGMDPSTFRSNIEQSVNATMKAIKAPPNFQTAISGYGLEEKGSVGGGIYYLTSGNGRLRTPDGRGYVTVDLRDQYLAARGAHRGTPTGPVIPAGEQ